MLTDSYFAQFYRLGAISTAVVALVMIEMVGR